MTAGEAVRIAARVEAETDWIEAGTSLIKKMACRLNVYVVGETIAPAIAAEDLVITVSGKTQSVLMIEEKARRIGCKVLAVTADPKSPPGGRLTRSFMYWPRPRIAGGESKPPSSRPFPCLTSAPAFAGCHLPAVCLVERNRPPKSPSQTC
ncbi:hypothetical protein [Thermoactinomyces sp. CICC 10523]|uniref:hypothetical protein n=1 Tax=Thermoactinomyces sp. CICC 10523 TaxID=2767428 RepID=UPI0018DDA5B2|nr:hypothetical protein [Thermoactinomyces sp. CICC 10523]MBH8597655.1 hypothetical protein [Thermoactinomyces sp. CICC 10523]